MGSETVVLDISSDEEDGTFDKSGKSSVDYQSSLEWLSRMLELDDEPWTSEDVVVVDEIFCTPPAQKMNNAQPEVAKCAFVDDSDDDCKVLDGDPDKPLEVIQNKGNGLDDLLIVGEKGQVACRDYPHSRHLCATFPFGTTSHEKFCNMCHCYVCDKPAPCIYWGTGSSDADHCHSTDKVEKWRQLRKASKHVNNAAENTRFPGATLSIKPPGMRISHNNLPQTISYSSMNKGPRSVRRPSVSMHIGSRSVPAQTSVSMHVGTASIPLRNSDSRLHTFRRCSTTHFGPPNIISQRRNHQSGIFHSSPRYSQQLNRFRNFAGANGIEKQQHDLPPQVVSAHTKDRMADAGFINAAAKRPRMTNTNQNLLYSRKLQRSSCPPASSVDENLKEWQDILFGRDLDPQANFLQCTTDPRPEPFSQSYSQASTNTGTNSLSSSPAAGNLDALDDGWLNATSVTTTDHVSPANSSLSNVQSKHLYSVPENNPVSGEVPSGECGSLGQEPQAAAVYQGLGELSPCTYDDREMLNSLYYV